MPRLQSLLVSAMLLVPIAAMAAEGLSNRDIAQALFVTLRTVEMHLSNSFRKLGISSRTQLTVRLLDTRDFPGAKGDVSP